MFRFALFKFASSDWLSVPNIPCPFLHFLLAFPLLSLLIYVLVCFCFLLFLQRYSSHRAAFREWVFRETSLAQGSIGPSCVFSSLLYLHVPPSPCSLLWDAFFLSGSFPFFISLHLPYGSVFIPQPLVCASEVCWEVLMHYWVLYSRGSKDPLT